MKLIQVGNYIPARKKYDNPNEGSVYDPKGIHPALCARSSGKLIIEYNERETIQGCGE